MTAKRTTAQKSGKAQLAYALDHVDIARHGPASYAPYCMFTPGWLVGYDGIVAAGYQIVEELPGIAPETETFRYAVLRAGMPFSISIMSDKTLVVRGQSVKVSVKCIDASQLPNVQPDAPSAHVNELWRSMLRNVAAVTTSREQRVIGCSIHLRTNSCVATNGTIILEGWHGCSLPREWLLPREFVDALCKVKYVPTRCGWSDTTFTVWFGDNAWLRTNLYAEQYPDTDVIFARQLSTIAEMRPIPAETLLALETLKPFVEGKVLLHAAGFNTRVDGSGASYGFAHHMLGDRLVPYEGFRHAATHGRYVGFNDEAMFWYGSEMRGLTVTTREQR